jgi:hypothetical protein
MSAGPPTLVPVTETELCWRCPTPMAFVHGTWQCPNCRFKLGCCEGEPQDCSDLTVEGRAAEAPGG